MNKVGGYDLLRLRKDGRQDRRLKKGSGDSFLTNQKLHSVTKILRQGKK